MARAGGHVRMPPGERIARPAHSSRVGRTLMSAAHGALPEYRGARRRGGGYMRQCARAAPGPESAKRTHRMLMLGGGCARVLAARHDALALRLGGAMRTRPRAVLSAHSARTSTGVVRGGGILAPSAERETLSSHCGTVVEQQQPTGAGRTRVRATAKHEARAPYTRAEARAVQQWHKRALPVRPADRGTDGAQAPWRGWANTRCVPPSKHEQCPCHAVGTSAERTQRSGTGACTLPQHRAKRSPREVAE